MSWKFENIGNLLSESKIQALNPNPDKRIRVKLNIAGVEKRPLENEIAGATKQFIRKSGQFIYGKQNFHKGAFGIIPEELDGYETSADIPSFDIRNDCLPEWIFYFFKIGNKYLELEKLARGVGSKRIHPDQLANIKIPLPSLNEQKLYLSKFKNLEESISEVNTENLAQLDLLKKLHLRILQDAVQGKLIQQDPNDEPASKLLERIKAEKEQLIKDKKIRKEKSIPKIKAEDIPFEIPDGWIWCRIGDIGNNIPNAIVDGPFGSSINVNKDYISSGVPVVRMVNVKPFSFKPENLKFIRQEKYDQLIRHNILPDDVLLSKVGAGIGETCKVPEDFGYGLLATTGLARFRVGRFVMPDFLVVYLNSVSSDLKSLSQNTAQPFLNMSDIKNYIFPFPPLNEQRRIVSKIDQLMKLCDELEQSTHQNLKYTQELLQVALKEALEPRG